jgi:hypothetical protein
VPGRGHLLWGAASDEFRSSRVLIAEDPWAVLRAEEYLVKREEYLVKGEAYLAPVTLG